VEPGALMGRLDRAIAAHCPSNRFITLFMLVVDPASGRAVYCSAGHNPALLVRAGGTIEPLGAGGKVLAPHLRNAPPGTRPAADYIRREVLPWHGSC
jgi:serine phosphatase RsbU (regulator of sigma subunit)